MLFLVGPSREYKTTATSTTSAPTTFLHADMEVYVKLPAEFDHEEGIVLASTKSNGRSPRPCRRGEPSDYEASRTPATSQDRTPTACFAPTTSSPLDYMPLPIVSKVSCGSCSLSHILESYSRFGKAFRLWGEFYYMAK